jgi:hypothetical protein
MPFATTWGCADPGADGLVFHLPTQVSSSQKQVGERPDQGKTGTEGQQTGLKDGALRTVGKRISEEIRNRIPSHHNPEASLLCAAGGQGERLSICCPLSKGCEWSQHPEHVH